MAGRALATAEGCEGDGNHVDDGFGRVGEDGSGAGEQARRNLARHHGYAEQQRQAHGEPLVAALAVLAVGSPQSRFCEIQL